MANTTQGAITQEQALVPTFRATIGGIEQTCVDARFLHAYLQNGDHFAGWINARLQKYGFEQGADYELITWEKTQAKFASENAEAKKSGSGGHNKKDYRLTLDMAKELSMVENNDRGREARRYFIAMERKALLGQAHTPAPVPQATQQRPEPQPAPPTACEKLNATDMQHLKRIVWFASIFFRMDGSANQGIWYYLRQVTNNPAPNAYSVDHIPLLAPELRRIINISYQVRALTRHIEEQAIKRIFRKGDTADKILKSLAAQAELELKQLDERIAEFPNWMENEFLNFTSRKPLVFNGHSYPAEQPDFFLNFV